MWILCRSMWALATCKNIIPAPPMPAAKSMNVLPRLNQRSRTCLSPPPKGTLQMKTIGIGSSPSGEVVAHTGAVTSASRVRSSSAGTTGLSR